MIGHRLAITLVLALILIVLKGQSGILSAVVHQYTEETSASIIPVESSTFTNISSLMGASVTPGNSVDQNIGLDTLPYIISADSVQAADPVTNDYLNEFRGTKISEYSVQPGDALSFIASDYGVSVNSILWSNNLTSADQIKPGQTLKIPPVSGIIHTIKQGDSINSIAQRYNTDPAKILSFNGLDNNDPLIPGQDLIVPDGTISSNTANSAVQVSLRSVPKAFQSSVINVAQRFAYLPDLGDYFLVPTIGFDWGIVHDRNGVDIANACGTPIYAAADGTAAIATHSGWNGGYGKYIKLVHPNGTETLYGHLSKLLITEGQTVTRGQEIALMGTTGHSTGCHLHFEVHGARNPLAKY